MAQQPRDVVEQHAVPAEQDRGPRDRVRDAGRHEVAFDFGLAAEVRVRGRGVGVGDGDVHDPLDAGPRGGLEQDAAVGDRGLVRDAATGEPDPVGVVEGVRAAQVALQRVGVGEVQRARVDVSMQVGAISDRPSPVT